MKKHIIVLLVLVGLVNVGCSKLFTNPFSSGGDDDGSSVVPSRVSEPTSKLSLAVGGVLSGRDEIIIIDAENNTRDLTGHTLECTANDSIVLVRPREGYGTNAEGSGVKVIPIEAGVTAIKCSVDGENLEGEYEVTISPQELIQIMLAEAGNQIATEVTLTDDGAVALVSQSPTGNALSAVIRNRINLMVDLNDTSLFMVDDVMYDRNPPESYYVAVITASGQFAPLEESDVSHELYTMAQDRNFLDEEWLIAYDQAVITAAGIFNGDIADPTNGAFAFRTPTVSEWQSIQSAKSTASLMIPEDAGFTDETFPTLAPIQILILNDIAKLDDGRPSFIFARQRMIEGDRAVTDIP